MTREHAPCGHCARFLTANRKGEGPGHCEGFDRPAYSTDHPCVLFNERGSWKARQVEMPSKASARRQPESAGKPHACGASRQRQDSSIETISRASATTTTGEPQR